MHSSERTSRAGSKTFQQWARARSTHLIARLARLWTHNHTQRMLMTRRKYNRHVLIVVLRIQIETNISSCISRCVVFSFECGIIYHSKVVETPSRYVRHSTRFWAALIQRRIHEGALLGEVIVIGAAAVLVEVTFDQAVFKYCFFARGSRSERVLCYQRITAGSTKGVVRCGEARRARAVICWSRSRSYDHCPGSNFRGGCELLKISRCLLKA